MAGEMLPYFKFFPAETLADERFSGWTMEERGVWLTLLLYAWVNGSIPSDVGELSRVLRVNSRSLRRVFDRISDRFVPHPDLEGRLTSARLELEREEALSRSMAGRAGATSRWNRKQWDATALRPHCDRNATTDAVPMPSEQNRQEQTRANSAPGDALPVDALSAAMAVWERVCVPVGFGKARRTPQRVKKAQTRMREPGWFGAFQAACDYAAQEPFYRGKSQSGWVMDLGWLLEPGNSEKTAEKAGTRKANGTGSRADPEILAAIAERDRYVAGAEPLEPVGGDGDDAGGSEPIDPAEDGLASPSALLPSALRANLAARRSAR